MSRPFAAIGIVLTISALILAAYQLNTNDDGDTQVLAKTRLTQPAPTSSEDPTETSGPLPTTNAVLPPTLGGGDGSVSAPTSGNADATTPELSNSAPESTTSTTARPTTTTPPPARSHVSVSMTEVHSGTATHYTPAGIGNCSLPAIPDYPLTAAMNDVDYGLADYCGAFVEVTGPTATAVVRITNRCPGCPKGNLDLTVETFKAVAADSRGVAEITWKVVSQPLEGPLLFHFKKGSSSRFWTAVQVRNHRNPVVSLEYWRDDQWVNVPRFVWNYFVMQGGMGEDPFRFRLTDAFGNVVEESGIVHKENATVSGQNQFPYMG